MSLDNTCIRDFLLEPFGQSLEQPIFLSPPLQIEKHETFGINNSHLRLYLPTNECFIYLMETVIIKLLRATLSIFLYTNLGKIKRVYHSRDS